MTVTSTRSHSLRVIVTGLIAQHPALGGVSWDYLQYPAGLLQEGYDVYYVEDSGEWPYTLDGGPSGQDWIARDPAANVKHLASVMERFGLGDRWAYRFPIEPRWYGMSDDKRGDVLRSADLLLNISGTLEHPEEYREVKRLAYIDSDPVFTQIKLTLGGDHAEFGKRVAAHDVHFSFGEALGPAVPQTEYVWRPTRQPILLDEWRPTSRRGESYTTVMSWTSYRPLCHDGVTYGQKDVEFERFLRLPGLARPARLEVAVGGLQHAEWGSSLADRADDDASEPAGPLSAADLLRRNGWTVVDPLRRCSNLDSYRQYIEYSKGEWSVAKNGYVKGKSGWFSCRSACYLAAGRPVIVQDTGFGVALPVGEGILPFSTPEEAASAIREVDVDYDRHAAAARSIAEEYFDSRKILPRLIEAALG